MLYDRIRSVINDITEEMLAGREECHEIVSFNLIRDQNVPITIETKLLYPLRQIKVSLFCPFLLVDPEVEYEEIYQKGVEDDELRLMKLIAKFTTTLERLKAWIRDDCPDMIRWGEGVIFDKSGRARRIPYPAVSSKNQKGRKKNSS